MSVRLKGWRTYWVKMKLVWVALSNVYSLSNCRFHIDRPFWFNWGSSRCLLGKFHHPFQGNPSVSWFIFFNVVFVVICLSISLWDIVCWPFVILQTWFGSRPEIVIPILSCMRFWRNRYYNPIWRSQKSYGTSCNGRVVFLVFFCSM